jgi:Uncharacterized protein family UPF0004
MNVSDSELVRTVLREGGYDFCESDAAADVVLLNTCAIREKVNCRHPHWGKSGDYEAPVASMRTSHLPALCP